MNRKHLVKPRLSSNPSTCNNGSPTAPNTRPTSLNLAVAAALAVGLTGVSTAGAATVRVWDGGSSGDWSSNANWTGNDRPDDPTESADTNTTENNAITLDNNANGYDIDGLTVYAGDSIKWGSSNASTVILTVETDLSNAGVLTITPSNTNNRSRRLIYNGAAFNSSGTINLTSAGGTNRDASFRLTADDATHTNSGTVNLNGNGNDAFFNLTGSNSVLINTGTFNINNGGGSEVRGGSNEFRQNGGSTNVGTVPDSEGRLNFTGGTVNINGGTLRGTGIVNGDTTINSGATLAPGASPGALAFNDSLSIADGGTMAVEIGGTSFTYDSVEQYDRARVGGLTALAGLLDVTLVDSFTLGSGQLFGIVDAIGGRSGTFSNFAEGDTVLSDSGFDLRITYLGNVSDTSVLLTGGNDVVLFTAAVPEPGSLALLGLGGIALLRRRRA